MGLNLKRHRHQQKHEYTPDFSSWQPLPILFSECLETVLLITCAVANVYFRAYIYRRTSGRGFASIMSFGRPLCQKIPFRKVSMRQIFWQNDESDYVTLKFFCLRRACYRRRRPPRGLRRDRCCAPTRAEASVPPALLVGPPTIGRPVRHSELLTECPFGIYVG